MRIILALVAFLFSYQIAHACGEESDVTVLVDHPAYMEILKKAGAVYDPHNNVIVISTEYMKSRPPNVQNFIVAHECGHYYLKDTESHAFFGNIQAEFDADAFAVRVAKDNGVTFSEEELSYICNDVGEKRCLKIREANSQ